MHLSLVHKVVVICGPVTLHYTKYIGTREMSLSNHLFPIMTPHAICSYVSSKCSRFQLLFFFTYPSNSLKLLRSTNDVTSLISRSSYDQVGYLV